MRAIPSPYAMDNGGGAGENLDMARAAVVFLTVVAAATLAGRAQGQEAVRIARIQDLPTADVAQAIVEEAYRRLGVEIAIEPMPAQAALRSANEGQVDADLARPAGVRRRFPHLVRVPVPIGFVEAAAFSRTSDFPVRGWHSLRPFRIGVPRGLTLIEEGTRGMDVRLADGSDQLFELLEAGEIDLAVTTRFSGRHDVARLGLEGVHELPGFLEMTFLYHHVHERRRDLAESLRPVLERMLRDGTSRRLRDETERRLLADVE